MFTITEGSGTAPAQTDRDGADAAYLRFVEQGFVVDPELCTSRDTVLVRGEEQVSITYSTD